MELESIVSVLVVGVAGAILLFWFSRRHQGGWNIGSRPIQAFRALQVQSVKAVETGRGTHMSLGRADLGGQGSPASIAALEALDALSMAGARSNTAPLATVGDGTVLLAAQDSLRKAHGDAGREQDYSSDMAQFVAGRDFAMGYAAGVSAEINRGDFGGSVLLGRFGTELAIMTEAGERRQLDQVIGSDDPQAMAIGVVVSDKVLIGEELFVAGAYMQPKPAFLAGLQLQDVLRAIVILIVLLVALLDFIL